MPHNPLIDVPAEASQEEIAARRAAAARPAGSQLDLPANISPLALEARRKLAEHFAAKQAPVAAPTAPAAPEEQMSAPRRFAGAAAGGAVGALGWGDIAGAVSLAAEGEKQNIEQRHANRQAEMSRALMAGSVKRAAVAHKLNESTGGRLMLDAMDVVAEAGRDWAKGALAVKEYLLPPEQQKGDLAEHAGSLVGGLVGLGGVAHKFGALALGATGAGQAALPVYYETLSKTGSEEKAIQAAMPALGVGATYALPAGQILAKAGTGVFGRSLLAATAEGGLGAGQAFALDKILENATGEDMNEVRRMTEEGGLGFLTTLGIELIARGKAHISGKKEKARTEGALGRLDERALAAGDAKPVQGPEVVKLPEAAPEAPGAPAAKEAAGSASQSLSEEPVKPPAAAETLPEAQKPVSVEEETGGPDLPTPKEEAAPAEPPKTTGIKNAAVEKELEDMGLPLPDKQERKGFVELHARAKQKMEESNGEAGRKLVDDLEANPRVVSDEDAALLTFEANRLANERDAAEEAHVQNPSKATQERVDQARAAYKRAADLFDRVGTEGGRALNARKMMLARDYSLAAIERKLQIAKGEDLSPTDIANAKKLHDDIAATTAAHEKYVTEAELKRAELEAENAMLRLQKETKSGKRRTKRAADIEQAKKDLGDALDELGASMRLGSTGGGINFKALARAASAVLKIGGKTFAQWADDMVARFGETIRPHLRGAWDAAAGERRKQMAEPLKGKTPEEMHAGVQKIALDVIEQSGIKDRAELEKSVHEVLKDVDPNISLETTRDVISGYGRFRKLTPGEARRTLRDLKGQMQQVAKLEALQARQALKKTGFERQEASQTQKRLAKQVRELQQKLGVETSDRLKALKTRTKNKIEELERRVQAKDFDIRPKLPPVALDPEAIKLRAAEVSAKRRFEAAKEKHERGKRGRVQIGVDAAKEVLDLPRAVLGAYDFSAVRRQGGFFTSGHPLQAGKHANEMFKAWGSPEVAARVDTEIRERPGYALGESSGLELTSTDGTLGPAEEAIRSTLSDKIPGVKASNRAYITYLNLQRATHFDAMIEGLGHTPTKEEAKAIADFVNIATGRAAGKGKTFASRLSGIKLFWAPSYTVSRFQLAGTALRLLVPGGKGMTRAVRKAIGKELGRYVVGQAAYYGLLSAFGAAAAEALGEDFEIGHDWRSSDFGKVRIGNVRVDPLSGMSQVATLIGRMATGETVNAEGDVEELGSGLKSRGGALLRYGRSKLGPIQGMLADALFQETYTGKKITPTEALLQPPVPLAFVDAFKAMDELGIPTGTALTLLGLLGDSIQVYEPKNER